MPKDTGYTLYTCDRNPKHNAFAKDGTPTAGTFHTISRIRSDGTNQSYVLCDKCYQLYKILSDKQDTDFNAFMAEDK